MARSRPKPNPDDRSDNVENLQSAVQDTIENMDAANDTLQNEDLTAEQKQQIREKNERREESIGGMRAEIMDEARNRQRK